MKEILKELDNGESVLIDQIDLPQFWEYSMSQPECRSFRYEYPESMVKIESTDIHIITRVKS